MKKTTNKQINKQAGFGLPSMIAAVLVGALLSAAFISAIGSNSEQAKIANVRTFFTDGMNDAVGWCFSSTGGLASCDKAKLVTIGNISTTNQTTEWGDTWTATAAAATGVTVVYPLDSSSDADTTGASLVTALNNSNAPVTATYDIDTDDLTVIYSF